MTHYIIQTFSGNASAIETFEEDLLGVSWEITELASSPRRAEGNLLEIESSCKSRWRPVGVRALKECCSASEWVASVSSSFCYSFSSCFFFSSIFFSFSSCFPLFFFFIFFFPYRFFFLFFFFLIFFFLFFLLLFIMSFRFYVVFPLHL